MKLMYTAIIVLVVFIAVWTLLVIPAERRHHERKLEALQKQIKKREEQQEN